MKKRTIIALCLALCVTVLSGCQNTNNQDTSANQNAEAQTTAALEHDGKTLVAYFTRLPNTESGDDLDAVVQGGGPYGDIGDSFESADLDAISSASITVTDEPRGNTETVALWIAEETDGDMFSIETKRKYALDYDEVIDEGGVERRQNARPELVTHVENIEEYDIIYLGFPNWYSDMPMALYTFLEEYDLEGKTIIPFCTSAGSGFSRTINTIKELQPNAHVMERGLALPMREVRDSREEVIAWVNSF